MVAKIESVRVPPEWFDLEKYQKAEFFSIDDWVISLRIRKNIFDSFKLMEGSGLSISWLFEIAKDLEQDLQQLRCNPLDLGAGQPWASLIGNYEEKTGIAPVRKLTFSDLITQYQLDQHELEIDQHKPEDSELIKLLANRWNLITTPSHVVTPHELIDMPIGPIREAGEPLLVDLRATDSVLITAFSRWLKSERAKQPASFSSKRELPAYNDWAGFGLLPYLDLTLWERETGNQITHHVMAQAIGYFRGGDSFRKTVPGLAAKLMHDLTELECLAAIESATPDKPE